MQTMCFFFVFTVQVIGARLGVYLVVVPFKLSPVNGVYY